MEMIRAHPHKTLDLGGLAPRFINPSQSIYVFPNQEPATGSSALAHGSMGRQAPVRPRRADMYFFTVHQRSSLYSFRPDL